VLRAGVIAALVFVMGLLLLNRFVERMIFYPSPGVDLRPQALGLEGEEVLLRSEDGVRLHAFYLPAPDATRAVLFLHGNAGNASHRLPNAAELVRLGATVLLPDYRGYGLSEGTPSEKGCYADARAALAHLIDERQFPEDRIVLFGRSLGGSVAVDLAQDRDLAGVILESTFTSAADVVKHSFGRAVAPLVGGMLASDQKIGRIRSPLLFFHGDRDEIIDYEIGRKLFEVAPEPKAFETIAGAGHNDTVQRGGPAYFARIRSFLDEVAP
jgi:pimeloyl-ACP methyl ester carboxylesterase